MSSPYAIDAYVADLLDRGFYSTAFQPIVEAKSMSPLGYESLLRGPEGTPLASPGTLFCERGAIGRDLMLRLDRACIESAVRTGRRLPEDCKLFVNIQSDTMARLAGETEAFLVLLDQIDVSPKRIVFEISENATQGCTDVAARSMEAIRRLGATIALDDIGIRSPYLYHILHLEPEFIKLDRVFIKDVDKDTRKQDLVHGMDCFSERMGTRLIAEGVETREEFETLKNLGVSLVQGFYLGTPGPAEKWLNGWGDSLAGNCPAKQESGI